MDVDKFLALSETFLRDVMRKVELEDRLRMREVCRAFERLVADTSAGFCGRGWIQLGNNKTYIKLGNLEINTERSSEDLLEQVLQFRRCFFSGISFERFRILLDDNAYSSQFLFGFTNNLQTEELFMKASSDIQLEMAVALFSGFPRSKTSIFIDYCPDTQKLLSLNSMEHIEILFGNGDISSDVFFKLLISHKDIRLEESVRQLGNDYQPGHVNITSQKWARAMQIISTDSRDRTVELSVDPSSIDHWLSDFGISQVAESGAVCGEFHVVENIDHGRSMTLCYRNCWTSIDDLNGVSKSVIFRVSLFV
ncbi:hypothetical protein PENTCL1PPCAC_13288 [Pristionchus entomophagus]|uniref:F-box domain-containing protein n=1 Tax=Pristionchus entomophagus TaxID=358040 RepID=A0AAV5T7B3_9BILA|nr:hypothetical protein PENTCL1PPCAC_13288 [Pristionchus entomophagus]